MSDIKLVKNVLKTKVPIPSKWEKAIAEKGTYTGTFIYGKFNAETCDVDVILPPDFKEFTFHDCIGLGHGIYLSDYRQDTHDSLYVKSQKGVIYNLLFMYNQTEYRAWRTTTEILAELQNQTGKTMPPILKSMIDENRDFRVELFRLIREGLKKQWL